MVVVQVGDGVPPWVGSEYLSEERLEAVLAEGPPPMPPDDAVVTRVPFSTGEMPSGPDIVRLLLWMMSESPELDDDDRLLDSLTGWQRIASYATGQLWQTMAELRNRKAGPLERATAAAERALEAGSAEVDEADVDALEGQARLAERSVVAEMALVLSWSQYKTSREVTTATRLVRDFNDTFVAVGRGDLEPGKADVICQLLGDQPDDVKARVESIVLPGAAGWTVPQLREQIKDATLRVAPELASERARAAREQRRVWILPRPNDMLLLHALMPVDEGIKAITALGLATDAAATPGDERTVAQRRLDVLVDALIDTAATDTTADEAAQQTGAASGMPATGTPATGMATGTPASGAAAAVELADVETGAAGLTGATRGTDPAASAAPADPANPANPAEAAEAAGSSPPRGRPPRKRKPRTPLKMEIGVMIPLETLTGDTEHPGYLNQYGPITAETARRLAASVAEDGVWRCLVTDDVHGTLLGMGRSLFTPAYQAPELLKRFVNYRDRFCTAPGCRRQAADCDFEHLIPHDQGGATCDCNGRPNCRSCHRLKTLADWTVRHSTNPADPPGTEIWTTPSGREYANTPPVIGVPRPRNNAHHRDARAAGLNPYLPQAQRPAPPPADPGPPPF